MSNLLNDTQKYSVPLGLAFDIPILFIGFEVSLKDTSLAITAPQSPQYLSLGSIRLPQLLQQGSFLRSIANPHIAQNLSSLSILDPHLEQ